MLQLHYDLISRLASSDNLKQGNYLKLSEEITRQASEVMNVSRVSVWMFSEDGNKLVCIKIYQSSDRSFSQGSELSVEEYPQYFESLRSKRTIVADDALSDDATSEFANIYLKPLGISSMMDSGIREGEQVVGVVCFEHVGKKRTWLIEEISLAGVLGDMISNSYNIFKRKLVEVALLEKQEKLENLNTTLKTVLSRLEEERNAIQEDVAVNVEKNIRPLLLQLREKGGDKGILMQLEANLDLISSGFYKKLAKYNYNLTSNERKICQLIKVGYLGKEIAAMMGLAYSTIETHKKNIRKKLGITNTQTNLKSYLDDLD